MAPAGGGMRLILHGVQNFKKEEFRRFDFGTTEENMRVYGQEEPPEYKVGQAMDGGAWTFSMNMNRTVFSP